ncbi:MAG: hypothetical protein M3024_08655 [Candidatus Dormibacteraeota bacterium]|nr:hypothetical protein [Candidatus Dormibacteraeota bacterium]
MGKRRVQSRQQTRQVQRVVKPKPPKAAAATPATQKRQRERYVESGGMLQGYSPESVMRLGYFAAGGAVACLVIMVLILLFLPYGWPVRIVAAIVWVVPIAFAASFILPGVRLARKDVKTEPKLVQGQLVGASEVSTSYGLGMLMLRSRAGNEQYLVSGERLAKVPGNQVTVMLTVTPRLRHVRSVGVMGQRLVPRPEQPIPPVLKRLRLLPIVTPIALAGSAVIGVNVVAFLPILRSADWLHALVALLAGAALAGAAYGITFFIQRRLYREVQTLMPGALG